MTQCDFLVAWPLHGKCNILIAKLSKSIYPHKCYFFVIITMQSFKFDGHIKPLLNGKMKQYGLFALCTPVNPANPFTSTPKELLQMYSCKMGLDLRIRKLDNR